MNVPGLMVTSVIPSSDGSPRFPGAAVVVDSRTPFDDRWGGWYVTGTSGSLVHRGNRDGAASRSAVGVGYGRQAESDQLGGRVDTSGYLEDTSDLIALMTLEHQTRIDQPADPAGLGDAGRRSRKASWRNRARVWISWRARWFPICCSPMRHASWNRSPGFRLHEDLSGARAARQARTVAARFRFEDAVVPVSAELHDLQSGVRCAAGDREDASLPADLRCPELGRTPARSSSG